MATSTTIERAPVSRDDSMKKKSRQKKQIITHNDRKPGNESGEASE